MAPTLPSIEPQPPGPRASSPLGGPALGLLLNPTAYLQRCRDQVGDTFTFDAFGYRLLWVFSPEGVKNLWALPEAEASKGAGDFALLRHKVPDELFVGRKTMPHGLFARDDVSVYLENLNAAVELQLEELGDSGEFEIFDLTRRLGHRVGLASWGGIEAASPRFLDRLIRALDRLDSSESFVHPHKAFWTIATKKRAELRALREVDSVFGELLRTRAEAGGDRDDLLQQIIEAWKDEPSPAREIGIGRDVVLVHMGSQSNLFAATAWTLIHLLQRPELLEAVRGGDVTLLDRCAHESIRLRQRSIVLRTVLQPTVLADEKNAYALKPGTYLATMMSVTNTSSLKGLDTFNIHNYERSMFARGAELPARELVTTFGHGKHSCPAQGFSISAIRQSILRLVETYEITPQFSDPQPLRRQIGGVARADRPCRARYTRRK